MWRKIWIVLIAVWAWQGPALGQGKELSRILDRVPQLTVEHPYLKDFYIKAEELLWDVFPQGDSLKPELVDFVKHGEEGPRLCFAGLALIPFHDPATVRPLLERAMEARTSPATRECFREAAYYVMNRPNVGYGESRETVEDRNEHLQELMKDADTAAKFSIGHVQARLVHELIVDLPEDPGDHSDVPEILAYVPISLGGFLDLKDEPLLATALAYPDPFLLDSMISILSYAVNRDFLGDQVGKPMNEYTPEMKRSGQAADAWWRNYLRDHRDGDWRPAVIAGFKDAGYKIEKDYGSFRSQQELLRALDDGHPRVRYNAYRLLNDIYHTHFDLEIAFFLGSYNLGASEIPRDNHAAANEARLKKYWQQRLGRSGI